MLRVKIRKNLKSFDTFFLFIINYDKCTILKINLFPYKSWYNIITLSFLHDLLIQIYKYSSGIMSIHIFVHSLVETLQDIFSINRGKDRLWRGSGNRLWYLCLNDRNRVGLWYLCLNDRNRVGLWYLCLNDRKRLGLCI